MLGSSEKTDNLSLKPSSSRVHKVLAHSYMFYFLVFLLGLSLDFVFPIKIKFFGQSPMIDVGIVFLVLSTILIFWAQRTSRHLEKEVINKDTFSHGPYCYTRSPTHWGLFMLMLGFGIIANAFFVIVFSILSFVITRIVFISKEEKILAEKYGEPYLEYQRQVRL